MISRSLVNRLDGTALWLAPVALRLLLAWEFYSAGSNKLSAGFMAPDWFAGQDFPFPFGWLPADLNWIMVTWTELIGAALLLIGLFTRFAALSLAVVTVVAIAAVHWPESWSSLAQLWEGYSVSRVVEDGEFRGNFRIPLLFLAMLLPLIFSGAGRLSVDHLLIRHFDAGVERRPLADGSAFALAAFMGAVLTIWLLPMVGIVLFMLGIALLVRARIAGSAASRESNSEPSG